MRVVDSMYDSLDIGLNFIKETLKLIGLLITIPIWFFPFMVKVFKRLDNKDDK